MPDALCHGGHGSVDHPQDHQKMSRPGSTGVWGWMMAAGRRESARVRAQSRVAFPHVRPYHASFEKRRLFCAAMLLIPWRTCCMFHDGGVWSLLPLKACPGGARDAPQRVWRITAVIPHFFLLCCSLQRPIDVFWSTGENAQSLCMYQRTAVWESGAIDRARKPAAAGLAVGS